MSRFRSWVLHSSRAHRNGVQSTPKVHIKRRSLDALGHSRGRPYRGSTPAPQDAPADCLWDLGGCLFLWQHSGGVPQPAHPTRSPQRRCVRDRRPAGDEFGQFTTSGGEGVVSGRCHCNHLHCRRADQDVEASAAGCLKNLVGPSRWKLYHPWRVALDASSEPQGVQLM